LHDAVSDEYLWILTIIKIYKRRLHLHKDQQERAGNSQNHVRILLINVTGLPGKFRHLYKSKSIEGETGEH
jgi:hypothetical protein